MSEPIIDSRTPNYNLPCPGPNTLDVDVLRIIEALQTIDAIVKALADNVELSALASAIKSMPAGDLVGTTDDQRLTGKVLDTKKATMASASTVDIGAANANRITITGEATINSFGEAEEGVSRTLTFSAQLTLASSAALILPGAASITTAAGDTAEFESVTPGTWRCTAYARASGLPVAGVLSLEKVTGITKAAKAGFDYLLENAASTEVVAPGEPADGCQFAVTPANGRLTNTINFGTAAVRGPGGDATGVITLDRGNRFIATYSATISKWVAS